MRNSNFIIPPAFLSLHPVTLHSQASGNAQQEWCDIPSSSIPHHTCFLPLHTQAGYFNDYNILDTALSNIYSNSYHTQQLGVWYKYQKNKNFFTLGLNYEHAELKSKQLFPEENALNNSYNSILPMAAFRYRISNSKNLGVFYRGNTISPKVEQLQNTIDNSNPLQLKAGNPELTPAYEQSLFIRYNTTNTEKTTVFL